MRFAIFCHSLISDWNHGNAHFLRGVMSELLARGHDAVAFEPRDAWSMRHLSAELGGDAVTVFRRAYPALDSVRYQSVEALDLERCLDGVDVVLVHEWNDPRLVARLGEHRRRHRRLRLFFHDTHHRAVTAPDELARYDLRDYDGVLAFGSVIREVYLRRGWAERAWVWHEAADVRVFRPRRDGEREGDLVWIGNWGDEERSTELGQFLVGPARALGLRARFHGVRYPAAVQTSLQRAGIDLRGWLPNFRVPEVFAAHGVTVHVPRRPYATALPGIPTIRPFEAMACGIPLISTPWDDVDGLFSRGQDYLVARTPEEMQEHLRAVLRDRDLAASLARSGLETVRSRHTCAHRVDELEAIVSAETRERASSSPDALVP